jgi:16S rRNA (uracil1498-N3)-methyltransferase
MAAMGAAERCFFLDEGFPGRLRLALEDQLKLARVLRVEPGERIVGLDGHGGRHPLRVSAVRSERRRRPDEALVEVEPSGEIELEPAFGQSGSLGPWIELCCPAPKGPRAADWMDRLVQLGLSGWSALATSRAEKTGRVATGESFLRLERVAREALKQCRGAWLPRLRGPYSVAEIVRDQAAAFEAGAAVLLAPLAERSLLDWIQAAPLAVRRGPLVVLAGPEGGFTPGEERALTAAGASPVRLAGRVLRIDTATELALGCLRLALAEGDR